MPTLALTLLDPLTGLVAAGVSVPALLLLYFLKLRRRPVRVTASFLWQQAAKDLQVNTPFRWLRVSLVLLLQVLALLLLCAAIARPALRDVPPARGSVIILLDASASMRATDGPAGRTRFEEAKRAATEFVRSLDLGGRAEDRTEAMVIAFAREPRVLATMTGNRAELLSAIERAEPTDQPGDLAAALALVDAFGRGSGAGEDEGLPVLVAFTDGGHARPGAPLTVAAREVRFVRAGPPAESPKANLGVSAFSARRDDADPSVVRLFARLVNASTEPATVAPVVEVNGAPVRAERLEIPGATESAPGEASLTVEARAASRAAVTIRLPGEDALASDNSAALVIDPPRGMDVVIVAPTATAGSAAPDVFLREAIDALRP